VATAFLAILSVDDDKVADILADDRSSLTSCDFQQFSIGAVRKLRIRPRRDDVMTT
jgi:hypothetical protein